jgi:hypothetical protein
MKKIFLKILIISAVVCGTNVSAQSINPKMVYRGDIRGIEKPKGEVQKRSVAKIELQIVNQDRSPSRHARIIVEELDELYVCDSLGNLIIELPESLSNLDIVHITIMDKIRINSYEEKFYKREITIHLNSGSQKRKIVLDHYKKRKVGFTGTPSF